MKMKMPPKKKSGKKGRNGIASVKKARAANSKPRKKNGTVTPKLGTRIA